MELSEKELEITMDAEQKDTVKEFDAEEGEGKEKEKKELDVNALIEKGKKGGLSTSDLDEMVEELDYDMDRLDKLYETLEDNGIPLPDEISNSEMNEIESEVESFGAGENMEKILEQEGLAIDDPVRLYLKEIGKVPLLDTEQEKELAERMAQGDEDAKTRLVEANLRLVVSIAKR